MLNKIIDIAYILKLKKNPIEPIESRLLSKLKNYHLYEVDGIQMNNEGTIDINLFSILTHRHTNPVSLDITKNFIGMIQHAYSKNYNCVLFLEEDAMFVDVSSSKLKAIELWLNNYMDKWDIFYLGYCNWPFVCSFLVQSNIVKLHNTLLAHSFILNKRGMEKVLNYTEYGKKNMEAHFDKIIGSQIQSFYRYAAFPMISFQSKNPALLQKALDKLNIQLSCKTLCRGNEILSLCIPFLFIVFVIYYIMKWIF